MDNTKNTKKLTFKNASIVYTVSGNKGGETILMLHPAFTDRTIFEPQLAYFQERYQLVLVDMPGHGESQVGGTKVTLEDIPDILDRILSENNIAACHVLGVSLGSLAAQAFADRFPDRVKSVIVVGGYSVHKANAPILKAQRREGLRWLFYILFSMKKFRAYAAAMACHTAEGRARFARGAAHFNRRSFAAMSGTSRYLVPRSEPVAYPLLLVIGEHDLQLVRDAAAELQQLEPGAELVLIPDSGHCVNVDTPDVFNRLVGSFLQRLRSTSNSAEHGPTGG
ncbi:alpha/beta fold hydrolase [Paenibacillus tarimensis]|uniref:alpha/beta fold hydrolase n=1 Tax=Paenibacillus tarimensis TaxID=416012 RepID=UPI001F1AB3D6|nr:alpha/beta hydrolase [Paenibacillus tarimensis]MCF2945303.1 alpha/beta hydrolase [Paenibacillus tarimensis]